MSERCSPGAIKMARRAGLRMGLRTGVEIGRLLLPWLALLPGASYAAASVMDALRDIKQVPQVCPRPDARAATPAELRPPHPVAAADETACAMDVSQAAGLAKLPGTVIVDTRSAVDFMRFHIDRAMNLAADAVRTRPFLSRHALLVVDDGKGERESYRQCAQLRASGYSSTYVLQGGMPAWVAAQLPVLGSAPALIDLITLSPAELFVEASSGSNRIIATPGTRDIQKEIPTATVVDITPSGSGIKRPGGAAGSVVVVAEPGFSSADVQRVAAAVRPKPVLLYVDGAKAYSTFLTTQKAVWAAHARGPKVPPCSLR